jgi:hypothetical protein
VAATAREAGQPLRAGPARVARSTARAAALAKNKEKAAAGAPRAMPAQVMWHNEGRREQCAARAPRRLRVTWRAPRYNARYIFSALPPRYNALRSRRQAFEPSQAAGRQPPTPACTVPRTGFQDKVE